MNKYDLLSLIGEGAYGSVYKARRKATNELIAIKKFKDNTDNSNNKNIKRTILREIKMLRSLKHPLFVVSLQEQFKRRGRVHLVFEYIDKSLLDLLECNPAGLNPNLVNKLLIQLLRAINWCHTNGVIHRDIKPENLLVDSRTYALKLCDFGFARSLQKHDDSAVTEYVATRWYRAPELLVGTKKHTTAVDIWPVACIWVEMSSCEPLFPGDSEIDQLYIIQEGLGKSLPGNLVQFFKENKKYKGLALPDPKLYSNDTAGSLMRRLQKQHPLSVSYFKQYNRLAILIKMLDLDPSDRPSCEKLIEFLENPDRFLPELKNTQNLNSKRRNSLSRADRKRQRAMKMSHSQTNLRDGGPGCDGLGGTGGKGANAPSSIKLCKLNTKTSTLLTEILDEVESGEEYENDFDDGDGYGSGPQIKNFLKKI